MVSGLGMIGRVGGSWILDIEIQIAVRQANSALYSDPQATLTWHNGVANIYMVTADAGGE